MLQSDSIILGNKDYDPSFELSRRWIEEDDKIQQISKAEFDSLRGKPGYVVKY